MKHNYVSRCRLYWNFLHAFRMSSFQLRIFWNNTPFHLFIIIVRFMFILTLISVRYDILFVLMKSKDVKKEKTVFGLSSLSCNNPQTYLLNPLVPRFHFLYFLSETKKSKKMSEPIMARKKKFKHRRKCLKHLMYIMVVLNKKKTVSMCKTSASVCKPVFLFKEAGWSTN